MKISASMIVKNEKDMLARCLESIKGIDEIIVCDTGSTDNTVEIAKKYTDKVYTDFTWCDDYSKARNHSNSKCTGDWILVIDADEILNSDMKDIRKAVKLAEEKKADFINFRVIAKNNSSENYFPRMFRNVPNIKWMAPVHNYLVNTDGSKNTIQTELSIIYDYSPAHHQDPNRSLRMLRTYVKANPKCVREKFYLGREYLGKGFAKSGIKYLEQYVNVSQFKSERAEAFFLLARAYWRLQQGDIAREACLCAIGINPNFKEALWLMGDMYYEPNRTKWKEFSNVADNTGVLFKREYKKPEPEGGDFVVGEDMKLHPKEVKDANK